MGSTKKIGALLALDGETEFRKSVRAVNSDLNEMKSELKLVSAEYKGNANSIEALTAKGTVLERQYETQSKKVNTLAEALENSKKNHEKVAGAVEKYKTELEEAEAEMERLKNSSSATNEELENQEAAVREVNTNLETAENAYARTGRVTNDWQIQLNNAQVNLIELNEQVENNGRYLSEAERSTTGTASSIDEYGNSIRSAEEKTLSFGDIIKANLISEVIIGGVEKLAEVTKELVTTTAATGVEFESAFTGVVKTVNATSEELGELRENIIDMTSVIPASTTELSGVAEAAGQLGIKTKSIAEFTETMVNMGEATNLQSEEAATSLAKLANVTGMSQDDFGRLGSTIVALGNNMATTEADIVGLGTRLAGAGSQVGMTEAQIMSMAAALSSVGLEAEAGGSAMSKLMVEIQLAVETGNSSLTQFSQVAGMSATDFKVAFQQDATQAIGAFLAGLKDTEQNGKSAIAVLTDMGITEVRLRDTILRASGASEMFNDAVELGNKAWDENIALTKEAETRYGTTESKIKLLGNAVSRTCIAAYDKFKNSFAEGVEEATGSVNVLTTQMTNGKLGNSVEKLGKSFAEVTQAAAKFAEKAIPAVCDALSWIIDHGELVVSVITGIGAAMAAFKAYTLITAAATAFTGLTAATTTATVAQTGLNVAQTANPMGILIAAAVGLTTVLGVLYLTTKDNTSAFKEEIEAIDAATEKTQASNAEIEKNISTRKEQSAATESNTSSVVSLADKLKMLSAKENKSTEDKTAMKVIVDKLNSSVSGLNLSIVDEAGALNMSADSIEAVIEAMVKEEKVKKAIEDLVQVEADLETGTDNLTESKKNLQTAQENLKAAQDAEKESMDNLQMGVMAGADATQIYAERSLSAAGDVQALQEKVDDAQKAFDDASGKVTALTTEQEKCNAVLGNTTAQESNTAAAVTMGDTTYTVTESMVAQLGTLETKYQEAYAESAQSINGQIGLFEEISLESSLSVDDMIGSMASQAESMNKWAENLQIASEMGIDQGLLASLNDGTVESAQYLNEIVTNGQGSVEKLNEGWRKTADGKEILVSTMADVKTGYTAAVNEIVDAGEETASQGGKDVAAAITDGTEKGIRNNGGGSIKAMRSFAASLIAAAKEALDSHSPSKKFIAIGEDMDNGAAIGIKNKEQEAQNTVRGMAQGLVKTAKNVLNEDIGILDISANVGSGQRGNTSQGKSIIQKLEVYIQPQNMSDTELDRCFNYINKRFGKVLI